MKKVLIVLIILFPAMLQAQTTIGQVHRGSLIFSTCLPHYGHEYPRGDDFTPHLMTKERREIALKCIERTFGKVKDYEEFYGDCTGTHLFSVTLESGDIICCEEGKLESFELNSSRFAVAKEWFKGGLRVGRKPGQPRDSRYQVKQAVDNSSRYHFYDSEQPDDVIRCYELGPDGTIVRIFIGGNDC